MDLEYTGFGVMKKNNINKKEALKHLSQFGYYIMPSLYSISDDVVMTARKMASDTSYKCGSVYKTSNLSSVPSDLRNLIKTPEIENIFSSICAGIEIKDSFITHEYVSKGAARNTWLHFDRHRCLKALVYLSDVDETCGAFSVVPQSHTKGYELRNKFKTESSYEKKLNRIKLNYPHLYQEPLKICGSRGTMVLFDTDIFHKGGDVNVGKERILIRSHWYPNFEWRVSS